MNSTEPTPAGAYISGPSALIDLAKIEVTDHIADLGSVFTDLGGVHILTQTAGQARALIAAFALAAEMHDKHARLDGSIPDPVQNLTTVGERL